MGGAGAPPLAQLLQQDEVGEALPRLIRIPVLFRIAFALMLFGRDYETHVLAAGEIRTILSVIPLLYWRSVSSCWLLLV